MEVKVLVYDVFTKTKHKGNPAGIVLDASKLSDAKMQEIAYQTGFNETAFIIMNENKEITIRYFTPGCEVNMCGHVTIGSMYALTSLGIIEAKPTKIHTKSGILDIEIIKKEDIYIGMQQSLYQEEFYKGSLDDLADLMHISKSCIDENYPVVYASTGSTTLLVPIKKLEDFKTMVPETKQFPEILTQYPKSSLHPFTLETYDSHCIMHGRHFSSPFTGSIEDAVTGTASGAMAMYYHRHINASVSYVKIEQGHEMGKEGIVEAKVLDPVIIYGTAVYSYEQIVTI